ncbi:MAG TPA: hypothetical protein V6C69_00475 [Trichormus sp.]
MSKRIFSAVLTAAIFLYCLAVHTSMSCTEDAALMACAHAMHSCCEDIGSTIANPCCCSEEAPESASEAPQMVRMPDPVYPAMRSTFASVCEKNLTLAAEAPVMRVYAPSVSAKLYILNRSLLI